MTLIPGRAGEAVEVASHGNRTTGHRAGLACGRATSDDAKPTSLAVAYDGPATQSLSRGRCGIGEAWTGFRSANRRNGRGFAGRCTLDRSAITDGHRTSLGALGRHDSTCRNRCSARKATGDCSALATTTGERRHSHERRKDRRDQQELSMFDLLNCAPSRTRQSAVRNARTIDAVSNQSILAGVFPAGAVWRRMLDFQVRRQPWSIGPIGRASPSSMRVH
jgi:hypothetical protein